MTTPVRRDDFNPGPVLRDLMLRRARKLRAQCSFCGITRPVSPDTGKCWPCDNLVSRAYPHGSVDRQTVKHGEMCNDCAIRPNSPEHEQEVASGDGGTKSVADVVLHMARKASGIFWCHKPFLEPEQQWGWDNKKRELVPLQGEHWRACGGWCKQFDKAHGVKQ